MDNRVGQADLFFLIIFLNVCTVFTVVNACVRVLLSLRKPRNSNTTLYHYLVLLFGVLLCWYVKIKSNSGIFFGEIEYRTPCCSKKKHQKPSLKISTTNKKKFRVRPNFRVGQVKPNQLFFCFRPNYGTVQSINLRLYRVSQKKRVRTYVSVS